MSNKIDTNKTYVSLPGRIEYALSLSSADGFVNKFNPEKREWSLNAMVTDEALEDLIAAGLSEQVLNPKTEEKQSRFKMHKELGYRYVILKKEYYNNGEVQTYAPKVTFNGEAFTGKIGNGTIANVTAVVEDIVQGGTATGKRKIRLASVEILDLVEYESQSNGLSENDKQEAIAKTRAALGL